MTPPVARGYSWAQSVPDGPLAFRCQVRGASVRIEISIRHGGLAPEQHDYVHDKAEKLLKYFGRLMGIEVAVDLHKHVWEVEILVSAEHKHDFVAREQGPTPESAMDLCVHKIEGQLRKYKDKVQHHKGEIGIEGLAPASTDVAESSEADLP